MHRNRWCMRRAQKRQQRLQRTDCNDGATQLHRCTCRRINHPRWDLAGEGTSHVDVDELGLTDDRASPKLHLLPMQRMPWVSHPHDRGSVCFMSLASVAGHKTCMDANGGRGYQMQHSPDDRLPAHLLSAPMALLPLQLWSLACRSASPRARTWTTPTDATSSRNGGNGGDGS